MVLQGMSFECSAIRQLEHVPQKWEPVLRKRTCSNKDMERDDDWMKMHPALMESQPIGWSASLGKRLGGTPLRIETAAFLQHGCLTRAASGARSKRDDTSRCGDRHVRHPPLSVQVRNGERSNAVCAG